MNKNLQNQIILNQLNDNWHNIQNLLTRMDDQARTFFYTRMLNELLTKREIESTNSESCAKELTVSEKNLIKKADTLTTKLAKVLAFQTSEQPLDFQ